MQHLADLLTQTEGVVITSLAAWLVAMSTSWLQAHIHFKRAATQKMLSDLLTEVIYRGANLATSAAASETLKLGKIAINTGNPTVDYTMTYVATQSPELLQKVGIDITTHDGQQALARRVIATLPPAPK